MHMGVEFLGTEYDGPWWGCLPNQGLANAPVDHVPDGSASSPCTMVSVDDNFDNTNRMFAIDNPIILVQSYWKLTIIR